MSPATLRKHADSILEVGDDVAAFVAGVVVWLAVVVAAPALVVVIAWLLLPVELGGLVACALGLLLVRCAGITPWTVVVRDQGSETTETYRSLVRALRRVRSVNASTRHAVQFVWSSRATSGGRKRRSTGPA